MITNNLKKKLKKEKVMDEKKSEQDLDHKEMALKN